MILWVHAQTVQTTQTQRAVHLASDSICYDLKNKTIEAEGHVRITYGTKTLRCHKMVFDEKTKRITVHGKAVIEEPGKDRFEGNDIETDLELKNALAHHLTILIHDVLFFKCQRGNRSPNQFSFYDTYFTACNIKNPLWSINADKIIYDEKKNRVYHYKALVKIGKVKLLTVPYFSHVGPKEPRGQGILPFFMDPISGDLGSVIGVPYYIPFSRHNDMTVTFYGASSYGLGLQANYRHNISRGQLRADGSFFKRLRNEEQFESYYWHADISAQKNFDQHLLKATLNRASSTDYLKKFWFLYDKGLLNHEPLISSGQYVWLTNTGYLKSDLFWIQNRDKKNPEFLAPLIEYEFDSGFFRGNTRSGYLERKGFYSSNKAEFYKTGVWEGFLYTGKIGSNMVLTPHRSPEFLPFGTLGLSYPLLHPQTRIVTEPLVLLTLAKPYTHSKDDVSVASLEYAPDTSLFHNQRNLFQDKLCQVLFGVRERFLKENCSVFLGGMAVSGQEGVRTFGEITFDPTRHWSFYSSVMYHNDKLPYFEAGSEWDLQRLHLYVGIAHTEEQNYTQYTVDTLIHINNAWSWRLGYMGNMDFLNKDKHRFLCYSTIHYENECLRFEFGGSLDRVVKSLHKKRADGTIPYWDYRILLQIVPKFSKDPVKYRQYMPKPLLGAHI